MKDVLSGLHHLHTNNIVHLDIKPDNIVINKKNSYKLADLGLCRLARI